MERQDEVEGVGRELPGAHGSSWNRLTTWLSSFPESSMQRTLWLTGWASVIFAICALTTWLAWGEAY
ncbi:MAG: hypothetical protein ACTHL8_18230 [Burkholderiaceae bacterium]